MKRFLIALALLAALSLGMAACDTHKPADTTAEDTPPIVTSEPTDVTAAPTDPPTEAPTDPPTEAPTEAPT